MADACFSRRFFLKISALDMLLLPRTWMSIASAMDMGGVIGLTPSVEHHLSTLTAAEVRWRYMWLRLSTLRRRTQLRKAVKIRVNDLPADVTHKQQRNSLGSADGRMEGEFVQGYLQYVLIWCAASCQPTLQQLAYYFQASVDNTTLDIRNVHASFPVKVPRAGD